MFTLEANSDCFFSTKGDDKKQSLYNINTTEHTVEIKVSSVSVLLADGTPP
jgi:hypothetical protein